MTLVSKTFELYGKTYTFESGELAKQATGACLVKQGDTTMLDTVVVSKERKNYDFFPLTVDFNEKMYAAGGASNQGRGTNRSVCYHKQPAPAHHHRPNMNSIARRR